MINIRELTDIELNRAMIWFYFDKLAEFCDRELQTDIAEPNAFYGDSRIDDGSTYFDVNINHWEEPYSVNFLSGYLSWDLTMPLVVENGLSIEIPDRVCAVGTISKYRDGDTDIQFDYTGNKTLRTICEVLVQIKLEQKQ